MSTALYRRYRSATFGDLIGQVQLATTLRNQVRDSNVAHAYLFAGMRGTGKTSTARILARAVNCTAVGDGEPCNQCVACLDITSASTVDVIEIDAASNRGIDEMRDLREKVKFLPAALSRKVYIIDEAHMLTNEAWNALLKTLEEPPEHVLFVLATTEPQKIPETVRSRVQRFDFRRVDGEAIAAHLSRIAQDERLLLDTDAAELLARASQGSVRDALSLMEQTAGGAEGHITVEKVRLALGYADTAVLAKLVVGLASGNAAEALSAVDDALEGGGDPRQLLRDVGRIARAASLIAIGYRDRGMADEVDRKLSQDAVALKPGVQWWLHALDRVATTELALRQPVDARLQVEQCMLQISCADVTLPPLVQAPVPVTPSTKPKQPVVLAEAPVPASPADVTAPPSPVASGQSGSFGNIDDWTAAWPRLIEAVNRRKEVSLAGVLRDCRPLDCDEDSLTIGALYAFHLERLKDSAKMAVLAEAVAEVRGKPLTVSAVFSGKTAAPDKPETNESEHELTDAVLETFAGSRITGSRIRDRDREGNN